MARARKDDPSRKPEASAPDVEAGGPTFEQSLERLESIVEEMESGDLPLEKAMKLFEEGVALGRRCGAQLDAAESRITVLLERADGALEERAFDPAEQGAPEESAPSASKRKPATEAAPRSRRGETSARPSLPLDEDDDGDVPF